jgi:AcrR family transcriptional regulator
VVPVVAEPLSRDAVVAATKTLIVKDGLDAVSLRRVGASLEVTAPALYAYVADKRDLLLAIAEEEFAKLLGRFERIDAADPVDRIRQYSRAYVEHARENPELFKTMFLFQPDFGFAASVNGDPSPAATEAFRLPAEAIQQAIDAGRFNQHDTMTAALTMWSAMHGLATVLLMGFDFDEAFEEGLITSVVDTMARGL